jgi:hypothetical protein
MVCRPIVRSPPFPASLLLPATATRPFPTPLASTTALEALGCSEALCLAKDRDFFNVSVASSCLEVVNIIKGMKPASTYHYRSMLGDIEAQSRHFQQLEFVHERKQKKIQKLISLLWHLLPWGGASSLATI